MKHFEISVLDTLLNKNMKQLAKWTFLLIIEFLRHSSLSEFLN